MWSIAESSAKAWSTEPLSPSEVLYDFDGPLTFTARFGPFEAIFHQIGQRSDSLFYLAVETSEETVTALKVGKISVRGALNRQQTWVFETGADLLVKRYWACALSSIPDKLLPKRGVSLFAYQVRSPDSIEQATAFFSIAFTGQELRSSGVPFGLLKNLIDSSYDAARRFLSPVFLAGARSATFDFPARAIPGSLIIVLDEPSINVTRLQARSAQSMSVDAAREGFRAQREAFFDQMGELVAGLQKVRSWTVLLQNGFPFWTTYSTSFLRTKTG